MNEHQDSLNLDALTMRVLALERWRDVEARLRSHGFTLGWAPPLGPGETLGELLEGRARGLRSSLYGDAAANCVAVEAVLADGEPVRSRVVPRSAAGPDWKHLLLGGHGQPGRISAAVLRVHRLPELVLPLAFELRERTRAIEALASVLHRGAIPAVAALEPVGRAWRLYLTFEGHAGLTRARAAIAARLCADAVNLGGAPAQAWIDAVEGGQAPEAALVHRPTLRLEGRWSTLSAMVQAIEGAAGARFCVTHLRHDGASMLVAAPSLGSVDLAALAATIETVGGVHAACEPAAGPVGARLLGASH